MDYNFVEENGKEYLVINCPGCKSELKFHTEDGARRVHCACLKCNKILEVYVPGKKERK